MITSTPSASTGPAQATNSSRTARYSPWSSKARLNCPGRGSSARDHPSLQPVPGYLIFAILNERGTGRDQPDLAAERAGVQHGGLAEPDHR
jgi:hypothetical protein